MTHCLTHQLEEDQATPLGMMCPCCKLRLYAIPPEGACRAFWESQPGAYTLNRQPLWVFSLMWNDFRIRSLHVDGTLEDERGMLVREMERMKIEAEMRAARNDAEMANERGFAPLPDDFELSNGLGVNDLAGDGKFGDSGVSNDFGSVEINGEGDSGSMQGEEEEEDEHWLDLPEPESWVDIDWKPEDDTEG
jgi:hypothetical protein